MSVRSYYEALAGHLGVETSNNDSLSAYSLDVDPGSMQLAIALAESHNVTLDGFNRYECCVTESGGALGEQILRLECPLPHRDVAVAFARTLIQWDEKFTEGLNPLFWRPTWADPSITSLADITAAYRDARRFKSIEHTLFAPHGQLYGEADAWLKTGRYGDGLPQEGPTVDTFASLLSDVFPWQATSRGSISEGKAAAKAVLSNAGLLTTARDLLKCDSEAAAEEPAGPARRLAYGAPVARADTTSYPDRFLH